MSVRTTIEITGAKQNNLKNISVDNQRDKMTVITGVSGSGKSSLAFDVIYGEGQRRFLDSISTFAKSRISQLQKAMVDSVSVICIHLAAFTGMNARSGHDFFAGKTFDFPGFHQVVYLFGGYVIHAFKAAAPVGVNPALLLSKPRKHIPKVICYMKDFVEFRERFKCAIT